LRRSRRPSAAAADAQVTPDTRPDVMADAAPVAPTDVPAPAVPLTRRELREMAARESKRTAKTGAFVSSDTLVAPVVATAPIRVLRVTDAPAAKVTPGFAAKIDAAANAAAAAEAVPDAADAPRVESAEPAEDTIREAEFVEAVRADGRSAVDEFEAAARLFSFTGETPVQVAAAAIVPDEPLEAAAPSPQTPSPKRGRLSGRGAAFKRVTAASATIGAMGIVGLMAVGMTTPAEAVAAASGNETLGSVSLASDVSAASPDEIQAYVAPATATAASLDRSDYTTATAASLAAEQGISNYSDFYSNNPNAAIQWPFSVGVPISYGFGWRSGAMHEGADFTPGEGAHVQAIAAGKVRIATESGGAFGVTVVIDHIIDGKLVSTRYGHMIYGSLQVRVGDTVTAGQYIGRTGNTGRSFGAHTHVEVLQNGTTAIDPIAWLRANAGRMSLDGQ
jgi:murein DD-endopeptidase MepM/ murein hydrolase activator NlpD